MPYSTVSSLIMLAVVFVAFLIKRRKDNSKDKNAASGKWKSWKSELQIKFYNECVNNGINDLSSPANKQKAELIAKRLGCRGYRSLEEYFEKSKKLSIQKDAQDSFEKLIADLSELRRTEQEKYNELTMYAALEGRDKRVTILTDMQQGYLKKAADLRKHIELIRRNSQQKEIDWATHGGIASGIAGGAAGVAVAMDAQAKNAQIRAQNEANMRALIPAELAIHKKVEQYEGAAQELQSSIDDAKIKLVADTPKDTVLSKLELSVESVDISKTGAFIIKVSIQLAEKIIIFDNIPAVVDGTISADMYQENHKVGSALLVLPTFGIDKEATIEGICLSGAKQNVPYEIKFSPYLLWEMEK